MNSRRYSWLLVFLLAGCHTQKYSDSTGMLIVPGLGISNVVAVGMTPSEMNSHVTDLQYQVRPNRWIPSKEPKWHTASIPSLGIVWSGPYTGMHAPYFGYINFYVAPNTNMGIAPFRGYLSSGLDFSTTNAITLSEVTRLYGEPRKTASLDATFIEMLATGVSICVLAPDKKTKLLYYPADGIMFDFKEDILTRVAVYPKRIVEQAGPAYPPQGVGPADP